MKDVPLPSFIVTSSTIDKKLEIYKNLEIELEIDKNLEIELEIYKNLENFEFYFEIFVNFEFYFEFFVISSFLSMVDEVNSSFTCYAYVKHNKSSRMAKNYLEHCGGHV